MTKHYFKTKEQHDKDRIAACERQKLRRKQARLKLEKRLNQQSKTLDSIDKLSEVLAAKV